MGYHKILVAFDGSEDGVKALRHAIDYGKDRKVHLDVVTVVKSHQRGEHIHAIPGASATMLQGSEAGQMAPRTINAEAERAGVHHEVMDDKTRAKGEETLKEAKAELEGTAISYETHVLNGEPADEIVDFAVAHENDLIVVGNRGLSGLKKLVLGSVSKKIVSRAHCPVLVVK
ncbi:MAG TPA: universal stress protein [Bacillales bacterium]|nr:universal stress protein [Bacillales bacterium]